MLTPPRYLDKAGAGLAELSMPGVSWHCLFAGSVRISRAGLSPNPFNEVGGFMGQKLAFAAHTVGLG